MLASIRDDMQAFLVDVLESYPEPGKAHRTVVPSTHLHLFGRRIAELQEVRPLSYDSGPGLLGHRASAPPSPFQ